MKNLMEVFGPQEGWKKSGNKQREQLAVVHHLLKFAVEFGILCPIFFGFCFDINSLHDFYLDLQKILYLD